MMEIIEWLQGIEALAHDLYSQSAIRFRDDAELVALLEIVAEDEYAHLRFLDEVARTLGVETRSEFLVDLGLDAKVHEPIQEGLDGLRLGTLTETRLLELVARAETSEWNDVFLYVIDYMVEREPSYLPVATQFQLHESRIRGFLQSRGVPMDPVPRRWEPTVLLAEDSRPLRKLLERLLSGHYRVLAVADGLEALATAQSLHVDLVVSDRWMTGLNGDELLARLIQSDLSWASRFVLISASLDDVPEWVHKAGVPVLPKPTTIGDIIRTTTERLERSLRLHGATAQRDR